MATLIVGGTSNWRKVNGHSRRRARQRLNDSFSYQPPKMAERPMKPEISSAPISSAVLDTTEATRGSSIASSGAASSAQRDDAPAVSWEQVELVCKRVNGLIRAQGNGGIAIPKIKKNKSIEVMLQRASDRLDQLARRTSLNNPQPNVATSVAQAPEIPLPVLFQGVVRKLHHFASEGGPTHIDSGASQGSAPLVDCASLGVESEKEALRSAKQEEDGVGDTRPELLPRAQPRSDSRPLEDEARSLLTPRFVLNTTRVQFFIIYFYILKLFSSRTLTRRRQTSDSSRLDKA